MDGRYNHAMAIREHKSIQLWLGVLDLDAREALDAVHVNLVVKVTDVANNSVVLHLLHVLKSDDVEVAGCRSEDDNLTNDLLRSWNRTTT